jgi:hypothetical protein
MNEAPHPEYSLERARVSADHFHVVTIYSKEFLALDRVRAAVQRIIDDDAMGHGGEWNIDQNMLRMLKESMG